MNETEALAKMYSPGMKRPGKQKTSNGGVMQIHLTRACDKACFNCTQGSNLKGPYSFITKENFEIALKSLEGYFGTIGIFGGNPAMHPDFEELCGILLNYFPKEQCGLWCNNPLGKGKVMRDTFNPRRSNLNCHLDQTAYDEFKRDWPESLPFGHNQDSRHSPVFLAMKDVIPDEGQRWNLIANCDINKHWSAMMGEFRGELRGWFCEIAGAQAMLHQHEPDYPDTGIDIKQVSIDRETGKPCKWWQLPMEAFAHQVRKHCHDCGVPLRGYGEPAQSKDPESAEQISKAHAEVYQLKRMTKDRKVQVVKELDDCCPQALGKFTEYLQNSNK